MKVQVLAKHDVSGVMRGILRNYVASPLRNTQFDPAQVQAVVDRIKAAEIGSPEMQKSVLDLWVLTVQSTVTFVEDFAYLRSASVQPSDIVEGAKSLMVETYSLASKDFTVKRLEVDQAADNMLAAMGQNEQEPQSVSLAKSFFEIMMASGLKMGALMHGSQSIFRIQSENLRPSN